VAGLQRQRNIDLIHFVLVISSVPTLCEQNQLVIGKRLNFVAHRLCK
jgi:hypothetical protein